MIFYASKTNDTLNSRDYSIEDVSPHICVNPYYPVTVKPGTDYMIDSGAFQDVRSENRLSFEAALDRQLQYEKTIGSK